MDRLCLILLVTLLSATACSTLQPPDPNGPRSNAPPYPVVALEETNTEEDARLAWAQLVQRYALSSTSDVVLDPLTATVKALPADHSTPVFLPKVGVGTTQTEEEIRESLRRFIDEWRSLIGAEPTQLSLVEHRDESANVQLARYEQRPFRYALRGDYGNLVIRFNKNNRQVIELASSCLRNTDRLQAAISNLTPKATPEAVVSQIRGKPFTVTGISGQQTFAIGANEPVEAKQLVIYAIPSRTQSQLELHLAWEIDAPNSVVKKIYLDAISGEVIAVSNTTS